MFSEACVHRVFGNDNMFSTSGVVADLSGKYIDDAIRGSTLRIISDHDDLITTAVDLLFNVNKKQKPPTSRHGDNLI